MSQISYFTEEGLQKVKDELNHLKKVERPSISAQIGEARDKGDLSENAEYDAAKEAQGLLELKISKLQTLVANSRVVDESELDTTKVLILSKVKIKNITNGAVMQYTIVSEKEANMAEKRISVESPIAKGLLGKKVGEFAEVIVPSGVVKFEVIEISR
ncbi:MAG: transcription elongation factor GreA [Vicingaceae bacterium]|jgi:transcription elongation factor GreA